MNEESNDTKESKLTQQTKQVVAKEATAAQKLWNEIKNKKIGVFSLPEQPLHSQSTPVFLDPNILYLEYKNPSFIVSLEAALGPEYKVEHAHKYISVVKA